MRLREGVAPLVGGGGLVIHGEETGHGLLLQPLAGAQNQIWCAIVALACELTAWMQMLALHGHAARRWEPKRLRTRLFTVPATLARTARQRLLHLAEHHPWAAVVRDAVIRLRDLTAGPVPAPG